MYGEFLFTRKDLKSGRFAAVQHFLKVLEGFQIDHDLVMKFRLTIQVERL